VKQFPIETKSSATAPLCAAELLDVVPAIMRAIRQHMRSASVAELSVPQFRTLGFLDRRRGSSLSELAEHIGLALPSASKLVQLLLTRGYVHREIDPVDRRRTILAPTAKGKRVIKAARQATQEFLAEQIEELSDDRRHQVIQAMQTLRAVFSPELESAAAGSLRHKRFVETSV
jgi:MarR family transcriptional regulator for hemolysin